MAYNTHYRFLFESANGTEFLIRLKEDGYDGEPLERRLGQSPVLKREKNGHICGTSLEIYAECLEDEEFSQLYTSSPFQWLVELEMSDGIGGAVIWSGYVVPELYSEPDIAPPYDVQIIATDNLGELKYYGIEALEGVADTRLIGWLRALMALTRNDVSRELMLSSMSYKINADSPASYEILFADVPNLLSRYRDSEDANCYDVLEGILSSINAYIMMEDRSWWVIRENDCQSEDGQLLYLTDWEGHLQTQYTGACISLDSPSEWWPVGSLSNTIEAAHSSVQVQEDPLYQSSLLQDSEMQDGSAWQTSGDSRHCNYNDTPGYVLGSSYHKLDGAPSTDTRPRYYTTTDYITSEDVHIGKASAYLLRLKVKARISCYNSKDASDLPSPDRFWTENWRSRKDDLSVRMRVRLLGDDGNTYWLGSDVDFSEGNRIYKWYDEPNIITNKLALQDDGVPMPTEDNQRTLRVQEFDFSIANDTPAGRVAVEIFNQNGSEANYDFFHTKDKFGGPVIVHECSLYIDEASRLKSSVCTVNIANKARTKSDLQTIAIQTGKVIDEDYREDLAKSGPTTIAEIHSRTHSASRLLEFVAMDRAFEDALPRLRVKGTLNVPRAQLMPMIIERRDVQYRLDTYTWKLAEDEVEIDALSVPAASITIDDLTVITKEA